MLIILSSCHKNIIQHNNQDTTTWHEMQINSSRDIIKLQINRFLQDYMNICKFSMKYIILNKLLMVFVVCIFWDILHKPKRPNVLLSTNLYGSLHKTFKSVTADNYNYSTKIGSTCCFVLIHFAFSTWQRASDVLHLCASDLLATHTLHFINVLWLMEKSELFGVNLHSTIITLVAKSHWSTHRMTVRSDLSIQVVSKTADKLRLDGILVC